MALQRKEGTTCTGLSNGCISAKGDLKLCGNNHPSSHCRVVLIMGSLLYLYRVQFVCVFAYLHVFVCSAECCSLVYATNIRVKVLGQYCPCCLSCLRQSLLLPLHILGLLIHEPPGFSISSFCLSAGALSGIKIYTTVLDFPWLMCKFEITLWEVDGITFETIVLSNFELEVFANVISFTSPNAIISHLNWKESVKNSSKGW